jgi:hypothetical protein
MGKQLVNFITCSCESSAPFFVIYKAGHCLKTTSFPYLVFFQIFLKCQFIYNLIKNLENKIKHIILFYKVVNIYLVKTTIIWKYYIDINFVYWFWKCWKIDPQLLILQSSQIKMIFLASFLILNFNILYSDRLWRSTCSCWSSR